MASTIVISCPQCGKQMRAPAELVGKQVRCKECRHVFVLKSAPLAKSSPEPPTKKPSGSAKEAKPIGSTAPSKGASPAKSAPSAAGSTKAQSSDPKVYDVTDTDLMPRCPYCAKELETEHQVICLNCGYNTHTRERIEPKKTFATTGGDLFLWLLPGILAAIGVLLSIGILLIFWLLFQVGERERRRDLGCLHGIMGTALGQRVRSLLHVFLRQVRRDPVDL